MTQHDQQNSLTSRRGRPTRSLARLAPMVLLAAVCCGCGNQGVNTTRKLVDSMQGVVDLLRSITDAQSAEAATDKIGPTMEQFEEALRAQVAYENEHGEVRGLKKQIDELNQKMARLPGEIAAQAERVRSLSGLPKSFWMEYRRASVKLMRGMLEAASQAENVPPEVASSKDHLDKVLAFYEKHGAETIVEVVVAGGRSEDRLEAQRMIEKLAGANAETLVSPIPDTPGTLEFGLAPVDDLEALTKQIDFAEVDRLQPERLRVELSVGSDLGGEFAGLTAEQRAELKRKQAAEQAAVEAEREKARAASRQVVEEARRERDKRFSRPSPSDPNFHEQLVESLLDERSHNHDFAVSQLLLLSPADIQDPELRKKIAVAFRAMAQEGGFDREKGIRGLMIWAGKYGVPTLIEIMEDAPMRIDAAVFNGLAQYPTPEGAEAVAAQLGNFFNHDVAARTLDKMGPVAEQALIKVAPSDDPRICLTAIGLLGEYGTEACLPLLRQAQKSTNPDVYNAAKLAFAKVRRRAAE